MQTKALAQLTPPESVVFATEDQKLSALIQLLQSTLVTAIQDSTAAIVAAIEGHPPSL